MIVVGEGALGTERWGLRALLWSPRAVGCAWTGCVGGELQHSRAAACQRHVEVALAVRGHV
jgi:hypothetical protein